MSFTYQHPDHYDRDQVIRRMRLAGLKFSEIGERFGISTTRVQQLFERAQKRWAHESSSSWSAEVATLAHLIYRHKEGHMVRAIRKLTK